MAAEEPSADDLAEYKADDEVRLHCAVCARVCDACLSTGRARTQSRLRHNNNNNSNDDDDEAGGYDGESTNSQSSYKVRTLLRCCDPRGRWCRHSPPPPPSSLPRREHSARAS